MTDETQAATEAATDAAAEAQEATAQAAETGGATEQGDGAAKAADAPEQLLGGDASKEEAKDAGDGDREGDGSDDTDEAKSEVPETYELTAPEGQELDAEAVEAFTPVAKELGLSNEQAQELTDLYAQGLQRQTEGLMRQHQDTVAGWGNATRQDPEIGGDKLEESLRLGNAALKHAFDQPTQDLLKHFGLLNHPGFIRGMRGFGEIVTDDRFVQSTGKGAPRSLAERMYPNMTKPQR